MTPDTTQRIALPAHIAGSVESALQQADRLRQRLFAAEQQVAGLLREYCELLQIDAAACQYSREHRELVLLRPTTLTSEHGPQET